MAEYFIKRGETVNGPVRGKKVINLIKAEKIFESDLIGSSNEGPWKPAGEVKSLKSYFREENREGDDVLDWLSEDGDGEPEEATPVVTEPSEADAAVEPAVSKPESKVMECPDCGGTVSRRAIGCPHCGAPISGSGSPAPESETIDPNSPPVVLQTWDSKGTLKRLPENIERDLWSDEVVAQIKFHQTCEVYVYAGRVITDLEGNEYFFNDEYGVNKAFGEKGQTLSVNVDLVHRNWEGYPLAVKVTTDPGEILVCERPALDYELRYLGMAPGAKNWQLGQRINLALANGSTFKESGRTKLADVKIVQFSNVLNKNVTLKFKTVGAEWSNFGGGEHSDLMPRIATVHSKGRDKIAFTIEINADHENIGVSESGEYRFKRLVAVPPRVPR